LSKTSNDTSRMLVSSAAMSRELNRTIAHELIENIVVHQAWELDGQHIQQIDIYFRFVGILIDK